MLYDAENPQLDIPVQCGASAGWWHGKFPAGHCRTPRPPPVCCHQTTSPGSSEYTPRQRISNTMTLLWGVINKRVPTWLQKLTHYIIHNIVFQYILLQHQCILQLLFSAVLKPWKYICSSWFSNHVSTAIISDSSFVNQVPRRQYGTSEETRQHPTTQFSTGRMPFLPPKKQRQSTEGTQKYPVMGY